MDGGKLNWRFWLLPLAAIVLVMLVRWIDRRAGLSSEWALVALTAGLILVTGYYAYQTRETVKELHAARGVQVLPHVVVTFDILGVSHLAIRVTNVGLGAAMNVDLEYWLEPDGKRRRWRTPVMVPGEFQDLIPKSNDDNDLMEIERLTETFAEICIEGTCRDALGTRQEIDSRANVRETWELAKRTQLVGHNYPAEVVTELKKIATELEKISGKLK